MLGNGWLAGKTRVNKYSLQLFPKLTAPVSRLPRPATGVTPLTGANKKRWNIEVGHKPTSRKMVGELAGKPGSVLLQVAIIPLGQ